MPDYRSINDYENIDIYLPSGYDNYYRQLVLPYNFQNLQADLVVSNTQKIVAEINKGIIGRDGLKWFRCINKEYYSNELEKTFEADILKNFGKVIQQYYGLGNWDLTIDPEVVVNGQGYDITEPSILYPQANLFWNSFYNKYYVVWYTPIQLYNNYEIISKTAAENYIANVLSQTTSYVLNDEKGIILRATDELGFSPVDILSVNENPTPRVQTLLQSLHLWGDALTKAQFVYKEIKEICTNSDLLNQYLFIDEDTSIFSKIKKSYFIFNVTEGFYGDLTGDSSLTSTPKYWTPDTEYKVGDYILGADTKNKNFLYRCTYAHTSDQTFKEFTFIKKRLAGSEQEYNEELRQWVLVSSDYAKELDAIEKAFVEESFAPEEWVRFVFPALEDKKDPLYYPNGSVKPNKQHGLVYWGAASDGITLRPITHKYISDENLQAYEGHLEDAPISTKVNYYSLAISDIDKVNPNDPHLTDMDKEETINFSHKYTSPTQSKITFIDTSRKLIHYFKKTALPTTFYLTIDSKTEEINANTFSNRQDLLKVVLRSAISSIGNNAFYNCANLKQAVLPKGLKSLGSKAFAACTSLVRASIPEKIDSLRTAYIGCTSLQSVTLSDNTTYLGDNTFANCNNLEYVYNTQGLKSLGSGVFKNCEKLKFINIPEAVTELPSELFKNCKNAIITLENTSPIFIGQSCFEGCEQITQPVSFENVEVLYPATYKNCTNLKEITFNYDNSIEERPVPENFCYGCYRLKNVDLRSVTSLGNRSFQNCASLAEIRIPETVKQVGSNTFYDCFKLGKVKVPTSYSGSFGSWIENILDSTNRDNWVDPLFTRVETYNGVVIKWQLTTI